MRTFFDDDNREWKLHLTWAKAEEIYQRCERPDSTPQARKTFDLFNMTDKEQVEFFVIHDPLTGRFNLRNAKYLVNVLYVLCEQQCKERNITDVAFGEMMQSGMFSRAWDVFMEEVGNFIQDPERMTMFQNLMYLAEGNQRSVLSEANRILTENVTALDVQTRQMITDQMTPVMEQAREALAKAVEENGMTTSSSSAGLSGLSPAAT